MPTSTIPAMRVLCLTIVLLVPAAEARDKAYATGQLIKVTMSDNVFPLTVQPLCQNCAALQLPLPLGVIYTFEVKEDDIAYVAACTSKAKKSYATDWVIHDRVEYRIKKERLFLRRPNGKELRLGLLTRTRDPKQQPAAQPVSSQTAPEKSARLMIPDCH